MGRPRFASREQWDDAIQLIGKMAPSMQAVAIGKPRVRMEAKAVGNPKSAGDDLLQVREAGVTNIDSLLTGETSG